MAKFTLFELYFDDVEVTAPEFGSTDEKVETESAENGGHLGAVMLAVGALIGLAVVAVLAKKRLGPGGEKGFPPTRLDSGYGTVS